MKSLSKKQLRIINLATKKAEESNFYNYRVGAVLVKGNRIISSACNSSSWSSFAGRFASCCGDYKGFPKDPLYASRHAEMACILGKSKSQTQGATLYVVRIGRDGSLRNAKPCPMCEGALTFVGVKKVFYTDTQGQLRSMKL